MPAIATEERRVVEILPFAIEADHPRNCDLLIQCIPGCRLRSAISGTRTVHDSKSGHESVPIDQARHLALFPQTPGMQLHVQPMELTYEIVDPLHNNEALCERIRRYLADQQGIRVSTKINGVPTVKGKLDLHRMKSLVRECLYLLEAGEAKRIKGAIPTMDDVENMPGHFLLNPGSRVANSQPVYEKDWDDWVTNLSRSGG